MNFEDLQRAWQLQDAGPEKVDPQYGCAVKAGAGATKSNFLTTIFWRDVARNRCGRRRIALIYFVHRGMQQPSVDGLSYGVGVPWRRGVHARRPVLTIRETACAKGFA